MFVRFVCIFVQTIMFNRCLNYSGALYFSARQNINEGRSFSRIEVYVFCNDSVVSSLEMLKLL